MPFPALSLLLALAGHAAADTDAVACPSCDEWNAPQPPRRLHGNSWYVGTAGLSSVLVATRDGLVLIDGALPQSAAHIRDNLELLGYRLDDLRWILNSHPHWDHAGGIAALQRQSGALVASTPRGAEALGMGNAPPDDPQAGFGPAANRFPPVAGAIGLADGDTLTVAGVSFRIHHTPGHTPGGATWTWRDCDGDSCRDLVFADSLTAVSAEGFRFSDDPARVAQFRATIARVRDLPCDILVTAHPGAAPTGAAPCRGYADAAGQRFEARLADERAAGDH